MYTTGKSLVIVCIISFPFLLTGCLNLNNIFGNNSEPPTVSGISVSNNAITISGGNLTSVTGLQMNQGSTKNSLVITQQTSTLILARASSSLSLMLGGAYNLVVSTANAQSVIPITVQAASNSLSPSVLNSGGATPGQVLQWNGSVWAPAASGGGSGGPALGLWLAKLDGSMSWQIFNGNPYNPTLWDNVDGVLIQYMPDRRVTTTTGLTASGYGMVSLFYTTTDCSDTPHSSATQWASPGATANTGFYLGGSFFKVDVNSDAITVAAEQVESFSGSLSACTLANTTTNIIPPGTYPRLIPIASPGLPMTLSMGSYKLIRQ